MKWFVVLALFGAPRWSEGQRLLAGEWTLDKSKSELSGRMRTNAPAIDQVLRIGVDSTTVCATTLTNGGPLGRVESAERFITDTVARSFQPEERMDSRASTGMRSSRWTIDARRMVVTETISREIGGQRFTARNAHVWQVSENTDTLVITTETQGPRGMIPTRRVFVRVPKAKAASCRADS